MTTDERIDALTQSVELLASMHKDNEKKMVEFSQKHTKLEGLVSQIAEGTARLLHAVEAHEQRISNLEGNQTQ
jgi:oligoribonuclease (3'-5' exoribonuclease)